MSMRGLKGRIRALDLIQMGRITPQGRPVQARNILFHANLIDAVSAQAHAVLLAQSTSSWMADV